MKHGVIMITWALSLWTVSARELLIVSNEERTIEVCAAAIQADYKAIKFEEGEVFDLIQLTYQYIPGRPIDGELLQVVLDQRRPIDVQAEKIGAITKTTSKRNRFIVTLTKHGKVKSISRSVNSTYTMDDAIPSDSK